MVPLVDTHCHLNSEELQPDLENVLERAGNVSIARMMVVGTDGPTSEQAVKLAAEYPSKGIYAAVGIHPHDTTPLLGADSLPDWLKKLADIPCVRAIGETGLDYHYDLSPRSIQKLSFEWHVDFAREIGKPLVVHIREAFDDAMDILEKQQADDCGGIIHCFSGTWDNAVRALDLGFYISFAGPVTYPANKILRDVASKVPLNRILCETDSPYLAPQAKRGKINEPANVVHVFRLIAELRDMDLDAFAEAVWNNSCAVFGWGE